MSDRRISKIQLAACRREALKGLKAIKDPTLVLDYLFQVHARVLGNSFTDRDERNASFNSLLNRIGRPHYKKRSPDKPHVQIRWMNSLEFRNGVPDPYHKPASRSLEEWLAAPLRTMAHVERWLQGYHVDDSHGYPPVPPKASKEQLKRRQQRKLAEAQRLERRLRRATDKAKAAAAKAAAKRSAAPATTTATGSAQTSQSAPPAHAADLPGSSHTGTSAPPDMPVLGQGSASPG